MPISGLRCVDFLRSLQVALAIVRDTMNYLWQEFCKAFSLVRKVEQFFVTLVPK